MLRPSTTSTEAASAEATCSSLFLSASTGRSCTAAAARAGSRTSSQGVVAMLSRCSSLRSEGSPSLRCGLLLASSAVGSGRLSRESGQRDGRALLQTGRVGSRPSSQGRRTPQALSGRRVDLRCSCFSSPPPPFGRAARLSSCGSYLHAAARVVLPLGRIVPLPIRVRAKGVAPPLPWHPRTSKGCMILWLHPRPAARSRRGEQAGRARATAPSPRRVRPSAGSATVPRAAGLVADRAAIVTCVLRRERSVRDIVHVCVRVVVVVCNERTRTNVRVVGAPHPPSSDYSCQ